MTREKYNFLLENEDAYANYLGTEIKRYSCSERGNYSTRYEKIIYECDCCWNGKVEVEDEETGQIEEKICPICSGERKIIIIR